MGEKKQWTSDGYFEDESNYKIWTNDEDNFLGNGDCKWFTLDNQWLREYYMMTLGEYSGVDVFPNRTLTNRHRQMMKMDVDNNSGII